MALNSFTSKISDAVRAGKILTGGLDIEVKHIPPDFLPLKGGDPEFRLKRFTCHFVDLIAPYCSSVKPNLSFYEGSLGRARLEELCAYMRSHYPHLPYIGDDKRGDIGNTNTQTVEYMLKQLKCDAITVNPLMGYTDSMDHFLSKNPDTNFFMLALTSNAGNEDFLKMPSGGVTGELLYQKIAGYGRDKNKWNKHGNLGFVVGGTNTEAEIASAREFAGDEPFFLMPGYGSQGGALKTVQCGNAKDGVKVLPNVGRQILEVKPNDGETYDEAVVRMAKYFNDEFATLLSYSLQQQKYIHGT
jgi:orotidine-5'-phosphate decarboxylase